MLLPTNEKTQRAMFLFPELTQIDKFVLQRVLTVYLIINSRFPLIASVTRLQLSLVDTISCPPMINSLI